jgi:hypothetical protein
VGERTPSAPGPGGGGEEASVPEAHLGGAVPSGRLSVYSETVGSVPGEGIRLEPRRDGSLALLFRLLALLYPLVGVLAFLLVPAEGEERLLILFLWAGTLLLTVPVLLLLAKAPKAFWYEIRGEEFLIHLPLKVRKVERREVLEARRVDYRFPLLNWNWNRRGQPGLYYERFHFQGLPTEAYVGARSGEGVLLVLEGGRGVLVNPVDPEPLLAWARQRGRERAGSG